MLAYEIAEEHFTHRKSTHLTQQFLSPFVVYSLLCLALILQFTTYFVICSVSFFCLFVQLEFKTARGSCFEFQNANKATMNTLFSREWLVLAMLQKKKRNKDIYPCFPSLTFCVGNEKAYTKVKGLVFF